MEEELRELEKVQTRILNRISTLESSFNLSLSTTTEDDVTSAANDATAERLSGILRSNGVVDFTFKMVPSDYYDRTLEARRDLLGASSIHHLCKSIVLVNTQAQSHIVDCSNRNNSKYYVVIVQYTARFNAEMVKNYLYTLNEGKVPKKKFNWLMQSEFEMSMMGELPFFLGLQIRKTKEGTLIHQQKYARELIKKYGLSDAKPYDTPMSSTIKLDQDEKVRLAPEETSNNLTGFEHNAVTCIGMKTDIPVILDEAIVNLSPNYFWLGGGEVCLKMGIRTPEFIKYVKPFIFSCSTT